MKVAAKRERRPRRSESVDAGQRTRVGRSHTPEQNAVGTEAAVAAARTIAADCLCFRARRAARVITRMYDEALRPIGIRATQLTVLNAVAIGGEQGAGIGRLADVLGMDPTTLTRNLAPLERQGLIRIDEGGDPRSRVARLERSGAELLVEALPRWRAAHERVVETLGAENAMELRQRLDHVSGQSG